MLTELLVQKLPARYRLPKARDYRTKAYVAFAGDAVTVPLPRGALCLRLPLRQGRYRPGDGDDPLGTVEVG